MSERRFVLKVVGLLVLIWGSVCFSAAEDQFILAEKFMAEKEYGQAENIYKQITLNTGDQLNGLSAQEKLVGLYIETGRYPEAETGIKELITRFGSQPEISESVKNIADKYFKAKNYTKARELYRLVESSWPESSQAINSKRGDIESSIMLGDDPNASSGIDSLFLSYGDDKNIGKIVYKIGKRYIEQKKIERGGTLCKKYETNISGDISCPWPLIIKLELQLMGQDAAGSDATLELLWDGYDKRKDFNRLIDEAADVYRRAGKFEKSRELYDYVVNNWPNDSHTMWSLVGVAQTSIMMGDFQYAESAIEMLKTEFGDHNDLQRALSIIAREYKHVNKYELAKAVYLSKEKDAQAKGKSVNLESAQMELVTYVKKGDLAGAEVYLNDLLMNHKSNIGLPDAVLIVALGYYEKGVKIKSNDSDIASQELIRKALSISEVIPEDEYSVNNVGQRVFSLRGLCYSELGEYQTAIDTYSAIVNRWPKSGHAVSDSLLMMALNYEHLYDSGRITEVEASIKIRNICEKLSIYSGEVQPAVIKENQKLMKKWESDK